MNEISNNTNTLSNEMKEFYDKTLLTRMLPNLPFLKYGQKRPLKKNSGKRISFRRFGSLEPATTPLVEGQPPIPKSLNVMEVFAEVEQYGDYVEVTDLLDITAIDPIITETVEILGEQAGETTNLVIQQKLKEATTVYFVGGGCTKDDIQPEDILTANDVLNLQTIFKNAKTCKRPPPYVYILYINIQKVKII